MAEGKRKRKLFQGLTFNNRPATQMSPYISRGLQGKVNQTIAERKKNPEDVRKHMAFAPLKDIVDTAFRKSHDYETFKKLLAKKNITILTVTESRMLGKEITGVVFIDHDIRQVVRGEKIGYSKDYLLNNGFTLKSEEYDRPTKAPRKDTDSYMEAVVQGAEQRSEEIREELIKLLNRF